MISIAPLEADNGEAPSPIAVITLDAPPQHLWSLDALQAFAGQLTELARDQRYRCLIVTGAGDQWFCGGVETAALEASAVTRNLYTRLFSQAFSALRKFPGLTLAAINGRVQNEGLALALNCDFRLCAGGAGFGVSSGTQGLIPMGGTTQLLPRLVGETWAKRMLLCGHELDASQAREIGLVEEVVDAAALVNAAGAWARQACRLPPVVLQGTRQLVEHARMRPLETGFAAERDWQTTVAEDAGDTREHQPEGGTRPPGSGPKE